MRSADAPHVALWLVLCIVLTIAGSAVRAQAPASPEYTLKAAFIYNFALFSNWGERADRTITLCVLVRDPFGQALDALAGGDVGSMHLAIRRLRHAGDALRSCEIVYVTDAHVDSFLARPDLARETEGVLTISEREGAARRGIMIELISTERNIRVEFNQDSTRAAHVTVSSRLLRLARKIH